MRVLLIDTQALMLDFALRAVEAGHSVKWFFAKNEKTKMIGKGLVDVVDDFRGWMRWADLVVLADNTKYLREMDVWRRDHGSKVVGATMASSEWELNRTIGQQVLKKARIPIPGFKEFKEYDSAIAYVKREMTRFVSKPIGDEPDKSLSYVSKSAADLVYMLERWKKAQKLKGALMLQEFIPGCEMAVGGWFGPGGFNRGWCENWEFKALMAGDRGPNTGEMGTVVRYVRNSKLANKVLKPLEDALAATGHVGYVDVNCIIDEDGYPWPLEFTMRCGWPTFNIQQVLHEGDPVEWLAQLSEGLDARNCLYDSVAVGVVMALPDFPYSHMTRKEVWGVPVTGITTRNRDQIHPCEIMAGEVPIEAGGKIVRAPGFVTAGDYVLVATGKGDSIRQARGKAYRVLESLTVPSSPFWRPDIGTRLKKQLPVIQAMGYAAGLTY